MPQQACTTMFFLIPKNVTGERPIALMPTLIRWWEALRAREVPKWQQKYRVDWPAIDGRNGAVQQTAWQMLMEMQRFVYSEQEKKIWERLLWCWTWRRHSSGSVSLWCGPDALQLPKEDLAGAWWVLRTPEASVVRRMVGGAAPDHHGHLARVQVELLVSTCCVAGCIE